jgi:hypothetical protein
MCVGGLLLQEKVGMRLKRNPTVETAGCKPKPTAYEKYLI